MPTGEDVWTVYKISGYNYVMLGSMTSIVVGLIVSYLTGPTKLEDVHPDLVSPYVHRFLPKSKYSAIPLRELQKNNTNGKC